MVKNNRIEFIDLAKGVCIFLVVLLHIVPEVNMNCEVITTFMLPLFFCLSGLFYKNDESFKLFITKKLNTLLIPFIAWYLIGYGVYYLGHYFINSNGDATYNILDIFYQNDIFNIPIWFLLSLFWIQIFFYILTSITKNLPGQLLGVIIISGLGWLMIERNIFNFLYIGSAMSCMPFFYMGFSLKKTSLLECSKNKKNDFILMSACLIVASLMAFIPAHPPRLNHFVNQVSAGTPFEIYVCGFLFVIGILFACKFIKKLPFLSWIGRYSMIVLVSHYMCKDIIMSGLNMFWKADDVVIIKELVVLGVVLALMGVVIPFAKKFLPYITGQKNVLCLNKTGGIDIAFRAKEYSL